MKKSLNLSIDEDLIERAKNEAAKRGTSVSKMVENFFASLETPQSEASIPEEYSPSSRIRALRSSLRTPNSHRPDALSWDEDRLTEEIQRKHS